VSEDAATEILEVFDALLDVRIANAAESTLEFVDACLDGPRRRPPSFDTFLDAGEKNRIVEKHEMGTEDQGVVLTEIARRSRLELHDVVPRLLESVAHALSLCFLPARRHVATRELSREGAPKDGGADRDAR